MNEQQSVLATEAMPWAIKMARSVWLGKAKLVDLSELEGTAIEAVCEAATREGIKSWEPYAKACAHKAALRRANKMMRENYLNLAVEVAHGVRADDDTEEAVSARQQVDRILSTRYPDMSPAEDELFFLWAGGMTRSQIVTKTGNSRQYVHQTLATAISKVRKANRG